MRQPVRIRLSPFSAIRSRLLSFDTRIRSEAFGFAFTRIFGVDAEHSPAPVRAHVLILPGRGAEAFDSSVGFSFPLCGSGAREWTVDSAAECLRTQAVEFSHHLGDLDVTDVLVHCWELAQFFVSGQVDDAGIRHMIVRIVADLSREAEYVCIHEDRQPESEALIMAHGHSHLIRATRGVLGGQIRSRVDGDYSPSKPLATTARRSGPVASLFAGSP